MNASAIRLTAVSRRFGRTAALEDVTVDVPDACVCGLLGRNGAGKTTLMSIVAGHDRGSGRGVVGMQQRARLAGGWLTTGTDVETANYLVTAYIPRLSAVHA